MRIERTVENLQLGRLDDCLQHFTLLQDNIISMSNELDNFPTDDSDAYQHMDIFPDRIMRDDPIDKFLPFEKMNLSTPLPIPACPYCADATDVRFTYVPFVFK